MTALTPDQREAITAKIERWFGIVQYVNREKTNFQSSDPAFDGGAMLPPPPDGCTQEQMMALLGLMLLHSATTPEHEVAVVDAAAQIILHGDDGTLPP